MVQEVLGRKSLWHELHVASKGDLCKVYACLCSYAPPGKRLIVQRKADFIALGVSAEELHAVADPTFWAFRDFHGVIESFEREETDPERRVMGIEGFSCKEALQEAVRAGEKVVKIGHLSLLNLRAKVVNKEWRWISELAMDTSTLKPGLLRAQVREIIGAELRVMRHDAHLAHESEKESRGDLILFDIDHANPIGTDVGNSKVFCQCPSNYDVGDYARLSIAQRKAVDQMLQEEFI